MPHRYPFELTLAAALAAGFGASCTPRAADVAADAPSAIIAAAPAEAPAAAVSRDTAAALPFAPAVVRDTLANGLAYYLLPNARPADRAELRLVVRAGSLLEDDDQRGLAHFVEHMAFNGTANYPANELIDYLRSTGARFGPDLNAYTSFDETVYQLQVRTDTAGVLDEGLAILRDWAGAIAFDPAEIDRERGVVLSEYRSGLGAQERLRDATLPVVLANSRYAERLPIGDTSVVANAPRERLVAFYEDYYRPDLMAVVVVGDVDAGAVEARVRELFADLSTPADAPARTEYGGPRYDSTQVVVADDPEAPYTVVQAYHLLPEAHARTEADFRRGLAHSLYNRMLGARLRETTEDPAAPYSFAGAGRGGFVGNVDAYSAFALAKPGRALDALAALSAETRRVRDYGFLASELDRARADLLDAARNAAAQAATTPSSALAQALVGGFLADEPTLAPDTAYALTRRLLGGIALAEVDALAEAFTEGRPRAVAITGPTDQPLPTQAAVRHTLDSVAAAVVEPYREEATAEVAIPALAPVDVVAAERFPVNDVTVVTLANGVRVAYKRTDIADDEIAFSAVSRGGTDQLGDAAFPEADFAAGVGRAMGLGPYTPSQLRRALAGKRVGVGASLADDTEGLRGSATPATLRDLFELTYLLFRGGAYDEQLAEAFREQQRSFVANAAADPEYRFREAVTAELYGADAPRHQLPTPALLDTVDLARAYELYRGRFANATDWQFNFAGDFDVDTLLAYAKTYLGNLPSTAPPDPAVARPDGRRTGDLERRFAAGQAERAQVLLGFGGAFADSEPERVRFRLTADVLALELTEVLREDLGGVYGVQASGSTDLPLAGAPDSAAASYFVRVAFDAAPGRVDELLAAVDTVIARIATEGPQAKFVAAAREASVQGMRQAMASSNGFWLGVMSRAYTLDRDVDLARAERLAELLDRFDADDVAAATREYLRGEGVATRLEVVMVPEG